MKSKIVIAIIMGLIVFAGCVNISSTEAEQSIKNRFEETYIQRNYIFTYRIIKDNITGKEYMMVKEDYGWAITPLLKEANQ